MVENVWLSDFEKSLKLVFWIDLHVLGLSESKNLIFKVWILCIYGCYLFNSQTSYIRNSEFDILHFYHMQMLLEKSWMIVRLIEDMFFSFQTYKINFFCKLRYRFVQKVLKDFYLLSLMHALKKILSLWILIVFVFLHLEQLLLCILLCLLKVSFNLNEIFFTKKKKK